jgi:hypothetical protein
MPSGVYKRTITHKHSEETKKKISESKKGHSYNIGRRLSEEAKQKMGKHTKFHEDLKKQLRKQNQLVLLGV